MVKMMSDLLAETDKIIKGAADGQLDKRADASKFVGGWNKLVAGVNDAVTNIVNPMNVTADYVDKVAKGIIPPAITTEYKGQYNVIKINLNNMVKMMSDLLAQTDKIIKGAADGQLDERANADKFVGGWNKLVAGQRSRHQHRQSHERDRRLRGQGGQGHHPAHHHHRVQGPVQRHQGQPEQHGQDDERPARPDRQHHQGRGRRPVGQAGQRRACSWAAGTSWSRASTTPSPTSSIP